MRKRTHVRDYVRSRHGLSDHGGMVSEHDRGYEPGAGIKEASAKVKREHDFDASDLTGLSVAQAMQKYGLSEDELRSFMQQSELNTCDKCKEIGYSDELNWITGEGFEPKEGEKVPEDAYDKYDALCETCYHDVISNKTSQFSKNILSEAEVLLLKRRLNAGKIKPSDIPWPEEGYKLTPEQSQKGLDWLLDQWKTPYGVERKNNPFGYREQDVLEHFKEFKLIDFYDASTYDQNKMGFHNYLPYYRVIGTDGGTFEYYNDYKGVHILG